MAAQTLALLSVLSLVLCLSFIPTTTSTPSDYFDDDDSPVIDYNTSDDYLNSDLERILYVTVKRDVDGSANGSNSCIARGGNCDGRPNECCNFTGCRCNLWGGNCRCRRRALFQKWGK